MSSREIAVFAFEEKEYIFETVIFTRSKHEPFFVVLARKDYSSEYTVAIILFRSVMMVSTFV